MKPGDWRTAIQNDDMPLTATADDLLDLSSEFVHNAVFRHGHTYVVMVNGWYYKAREGDSMFTRCSAMEKLDPVMFGR